MPEDVERDRVRQPHVSVVDPPDEREEQDDLRETGPAGIGGEQAGELRDREDEDQVEEELERRDPDDPLLGRFGVRHGATLAPRPGARPWPLPPRPGARPPATSRRARTAVGEPRAGGSGTAP